MLVLPSPIPKVVPDCCIEFSVSCFLILPVRYTPANPEGEALEAKALIIPTNEDTNKSA